MDTSALIALIERDDALHERAVDVEAALADDRTPLVTSDWVLSEFLAYTSRRPLRAAGLAAADALLASSKTTMVPATRKGFLAALALYRSRSDKEWSLVDCSSMVVCRERGVRRVFTHDRHFAQAGFEVLLP